MRPWGILIGVTALVSACHLGAASSDPTARPFEVNIEPTSLHLGDTVHVSYRYLGSNRQHRILFGDVDARPEAMLDLGEATTDPGTFSFVLQPRMVDRRDPNRYVDVVPGQMVAVAFVGYVEGKEFGATIAQRPELEPSGQ